MYSLTNACAAASFQQWWDGCTPECPSAAPCSHSHAGDTVELELRIPSWQWEVRDGTCWLWLTISSWHYRFVPCSIFSNSLAIHGLKVLKKHLLRVILHHLIILTIKSFWHWDFIYNVVATVKTEEATVPALQNCQSNNFNFEGAIKFSSHSLLPAAAATDIPGRKPCPQYQKQLGLRHLWPTWCTPPGDILLCPHVVIPSVPVSCDCAQLSPSVSDKKREW